MWAEDYQLTPDDEFAGDPFLDILPEFRPDGWDDEDGDDWSEDDEPEPEEVSEAEVRWRVEIEYECLLLGTL